MKEAKLCIEIPDTCHGPAAAPAVHCSGLYGFTIGGGDKVTAVIELWKQQIPVKVKDFMTGWLRLTIDRFNSWQLQPTIPRDAQHCIKRLIGNSIIGIFHVS